MHWRAGGAHRVTTATTGPPLLLLLLLLLRLRLLLLLLQWKGHLYTQCMTSYWGRALHLRADTAHCVEVVVELLVAELELLHGERRAQLRLLRREHLAATEPRAASDRAVSGRVRRLFGVGGWLDKKSCTPWDCLARHKGVKQRPAA